MVTSHGIGNKFDRFEIENSAATKLFIAHQCMLNRLYPHARRPRAARRPCRAALLLPTTLSASAVALFALSCSITRVDSTKPGSDCCKVGGRAGRQDPPPECLEGSIL